MYVSEESGGVSNEIFGAVYSDKVSSRLKLKPEFHPQKNRI